MPALVACPKCKKKYKLPDNVLGKGVTCTQCGTQFKTPAPTAQRSMVDPRQAAAAQQARTRQAKALNALGVQGSIEKPADLFSNSAGMPGTADPLANHVIQDPGFGDGADLALRPKEIDKPDDPNAAMFSNPALVKEKKKKSAKAKKAKKKTPSEWYLQPWFMMLAIFIPLFGASIALILSNIIQSETAAILAYINVGGFGLANVAIGIWGISLVAEDGDDIQVALCRFVPFYLFFYVIVHWHSMKHFAYASIVSFILSPLAFVILIIADIIFASSEL